VGEGVVFAFLFRAVLTSYWLYTHPHYSYYYFTIRITSCRINKRGSQKDAEQKKAGAYFFYDEDDNEDIDDDDL